MKIPVALFVVTTIVFGVMSTSAQDRPAGEQPPGGKKRPGDLRMPSRLKVGMAAPDFKLKRNDGGEVQLSSFKGKRPVVLVFGSYT